jgi:hypothetical protein
MMSFDTFVHNIGSGDLIGPAIDRSPDLFTWASCHQHYHFEKFARFNLLSIDGTQTKLAGSKLAYCMEDVAQHLFGSEILCDPQYDCTTQGIPRGRSDLYPASLDCQWLDITNLAPKNCWYTYEVCTNIGRTIMEASYDNNCVRFPLYVPEVAPGTRITYAEALQRDNASSFSGCKR